MKHITITAVKRRNAEKHKELLSDMCAVGLLIFAFSFLFLVIFI